MDSQTHSKISRKAHIAEKVEKVRRQFHLQVMSPPESDEYEQDNDLDPAVHDLDLDHDLKMRVNCPETVLNQEVQLSPQRKSSSSDAMFHMTFRDYSTHILTSFESLLRQETFADVTLICDGESGESHELVAYKAHKLLLSAASPYFASILADSPATHSTIVLKGYTPWEVSSILDFIYRGRLEWVGLEQAQKLVTTAQSLQIRGLEESLHRHSEGLSPSASNYDITATPKWESVALNLSSSQEKEDLKDTFQIIDPFEDVHPGPTATPNKIHASTPRRKQARPRRRSSDYSLDTGQDLKGQESSRSPLDTDLSLDDEFKEKDNKNLSTSLNAPPSPWLKGLGQGLVQSEGSTSTRRRRGRPRRILSTPVEQMTSDLRTELFQQNKGASRQTSTTPPNSFPFHPGLHTPPFQCPNHTHKVSQPDNSPNPPEDSQKRDPFCSRKVGHTHLNNWLPGFGSPPIFGRHRAQHSAPRGGPPRAWSNTDLTQALHNVWNKKMTTSQASRIFGIPYNSLLMYVRGKYGKSLKLDVLKKGLDAAALERNKSSRPFRGRVTSKDISVNNKSSLPITGPGPRPKHVKEEKNNNLDHTQQSLDKGQDHGVGWGQNQSLTVGGFTNPFFLEDFKFKDHPFPFATALQHIFLPPHFSHVSPTEPHPLHRNPCNLHSEKAQLNDNLLI